MKVKIFILAGIFLFCGLIFTYYTNSTKTAENKNHRELVVLTYDSFIGMAGPGITLKAEFEKLCDCRVRFLTSTEGGLLLEKLAIKELNVDVVLGLDQFHLQQARNEQSWQKIKNLQINFEEAIKPYVQKDFLAFDWSPMVFIYRQNELSASSSFNNFLKNGPGESLALQDPHLSTTGLQFLFALTIWSNGDLRATLKKAKSYIRSISPSWSTSYGLFQRKQAQVVFSYLSSLIYHWQVERDFSYQAMVFNDGHPLQVEYAGVPEQCKNCELAQEFMSFLLSSTAQKTLRDVNFMFPVIQGLREGTLFKKLPEVKAFTPEGSEQFVQRKEEFLQIWKSELSK